MIDLLMNAVSVVISAWQAGYYFENFGRGSAVENFLESYLKV